MKYAITTAQTTRKRYLIEAPDAKAARAIALARPRDARLVGHEETEPEVVDCSAFKRLDPRRIRRR